MKVANEKHEQVIRFACKWNCKELTAETFAYFFWQTYKLECLKELKRQRLADDPLSALLV